uniref:Uncharacterized protein n=1 Tax=Peronospora matthiolae TaxID=2874970 RepID=A0AAV1T3C0_9STRA
MAWLERHEPWVDWRSKTLGATRNVPSEALESHESTFARQQKRYWREPLTEDVNVLDIGQSELSNSNVTNMSIEPSSSKTSETARTPLSGTRCDNESLHAESMVGLGPSDQGRDSFDVCMVAREITPSAVGRESTELNVGNDIFGHMPFSVGGREGTTLNAGNGVVGDSPYCVGGREGTTPNVSNDIVGDTPYSVGGRKGTTPNAGNGVVGETPYSVGGRDGTTLNVSNDINGDTPYSVGGRKGTTPNVSNDTVGGTPYSVDGREGTTPNVGQDKSSRVERTMVGSNHGDNIVPTPKGE